MVASGQRLFDCVGKVVGVSNQASLSSATDAIQRVKSALVLNNWCSRFGQRRQQNPRKVSNVRCS
jgi:hypothetical protein